MRIRTPDTPVTAAAATAAAPVAVAPPRFPGADLLDHAVTADVLFRVWSGDPAVIVPSPPGAGKTRLVVLLAAALAHRAGLRVAIAAQTRAQARQIAQRLAVVSDERSRLIVSAKDRDLSVADTGVGIVRGRQIAWPRAGGGIMVATAARWLFAKPQELQADVLIVDEAWQCTYGDLGALACMAAQVVLVGDPGQIAPVVTGETRRWQATATGPQVPAPDALLAEHGDALAVVRMRQTWRLGPETTALVSGSFYAPAGLPFTSRRPPEHLLTADGEKLGEIAHRDVLTTSGPGDPALAVAAAERVRALLDCHVVTGDGVGPLCDEDVAVVVPHVAQASQVRALLAGDAPGVLVGTANALQGLERRAVVAYHPLAGRRAVTTFAVEAGRACVMLTRHRAHLTMICDPASPDLSEADDHYVRSLAAVTALVEETPEV